MKSGKAPSRHLTQGQTHFNNQKITPNPWLQPTAFDGGTCGFTGLSVVLVFVAFFANIGGG